MPPLIERLSLVSGVDIDRTPKDALKLMIPANVPVEDHPALTERARRIATTSNTYRLNSFTYFLIYVGFLPIWSVGFLLEELGCLVHLLYVRRLNNGSPARRAKTCS
jgi:hypothetical protein